MRFLSYDNDFVITKQFPFEIIFAKQIIPGV